MRLLQSIFLASLDPLPGQKGTNICDRRFNWSKMEGSCFSAVWLLIPGYNIVLFTNSTSQLDPTAGVEADAIHWSIIRTADLVL
jgi:hypothetical protein